MPSHAVVALVACVLVDQLIDPCERHHRRPRPRERRRIRDGELVRDRVGADPREALHQARLGARPLKARLPLEVDRLDHERVALPAAARVADPAWERAMRAAIKRDDPCLVNHLGLKNDVVARLDDLHIVVVRARDHRRPGVEPEEAPVGEAEGLGRVEAAGAPAAAPCAAQRDAAVGRIDDERRPLVFGQLVASLVPEVVVGEHAALRSGRIAGARLAFLRIIRVAVQAEVLAGLERWPPLRASACPYPRGPRASGAA